MAIVDFWLPNAFCYRANSIIGNRESKLRCAGGRVAASRKELTSRDSESPKTTHLVVLRIMQTNDEHD